MTLRSAKVSSQDETNDIESQPLSPISEEALNEPCFEKQRASIWLRFDNSNEYDWLKMK